MVRKLKFHEKKLLKKVDFISWEADNNLHEVKLMKRFCILKRETYIKYKNVSREIRELSRRLKTLDAKDPFREEACSQFLDKLVPLFGELDFHHIKNRPCGEANECVLYTWKYIYGRYSMGLIPTKQNLQLANKITATSFCRRRLPVVMVRSHMAEDLKSATKFVQQGHVRVGPEMITDPAFLLTRNMEDFLTWTDTSAIRKHVLEYNDLRDDFDT